MAIAVRRPGANNGSYSASVRSLGFSVNFVGTDGAYRCSDEVLAHEFGHNLGTFTIGRTAEHRIHTGIMVTGTVSMGSMALL